MEALKPVHQPILIPFVLLFPVTPFLNPMTDPMTLLIFLLYFHVLMPTSKPPAPASLFNHLCHILTSYVWHARIYYLNIVVK